MENIGLVAFAVALSICRSSCCSEVVPPQKSCLGTYTLATRLFEFSGDTDGAIPVKHAARVYNPCGVAVPSCWLSGAMTLASLQILCRDVIGRFKFWFLLNWFSQKRQTYSTKTKLNSSDRKAIQQEPCIMDPNVGRWSVNDVVHWARWVRLSAETIEALSDNAVDGSTLITMTKGELSSELGLWSLPARRYLWDWIERLRTEQYVLDHALAIDALTAEVENLNFKDPDESVAIQSLVSDAAKERQIIEDHFRACRMQEVGSQECYEDSEFARREQARLDQLHIQSECDRRIAVSMVPERQRPAEAPDNDAKSLFGRCIDVCARSRNEVADRAEGAFDHLDDLTLDGWSIGDRTKTEEQDSVHELAALPLINRCNVCYEESRQGFVLPCTHPYCVDCMRKYLDRALRDTSLLPLKCCEIDIDIRVAPLLMDKADANVLLARTAELQATNKMYCPTCNTFFNLDLVDSSESVELQCDCGTMLCTSCRTAYHPHMTCAANKAAIEGSDEPLHELAREQGWKQCPRCNIMINLVVGCNHMTCASCNHEFCFLCLQEWNRSGGVCSSGRCEVWDEDRLLAAGEARVQAQEQANQVRNQHAPIIPVNPVVHQLRVQREMAALRRNENCAHNWVKRYQKGSCERCGYELWSYAMVCSAGCGAAVCFVCANHRIPSRGWR